MDLLIKYFLTYMPIVGEEGTKVCIGSDCIFADEVHMRKANQHCVYDEKRKKLIVLEISESPIMF